MDLLLDWLFQIYTLLTDTDDLQIKLGNLVFSALGYSTYRNETTDCHVCNQVHQMDVSLLKASIQWPLGAFAICA